MQNSPPLLLLLAVLAGVLGVVAVVAGLRLRPAGLSHGSTLAAFLTGLGMLGLFYSLAYHMHQSLGGWPTSIGDRGFPAPLVTHASIAYHCFGIMLLAGLFAWPVAFLLCAFIRRWRGGLFYLGVYALSCLICFGAMLLAPSQYLNWWWD